MKFDFLLYGGHLIYGAIGNDIIRGSMGVSLFTDTRLILVVCTPEFIKHAKEMTKNYPIHLVESTKTEYHSIEKPERCTITHNWTDTLEFIFDYSRNWDSIIIINEVPPLYDRIKKYFHYKRSVINIILGFSPVVRQLTGRHRSMLNKAKLRVAISDEENMVMEKVYGVNHEIVLYEPTDNSLFKYHESPKRSNILLFNANKSVLEGAVLQGIKKISRTIH